MAARPAGAVRFESTLEREEARPAQPLLDPAAPRSGELVVVCGWCKQVKLGAERWVEVEEAAVALKLFERPTIPRVSHGICERCSAAVRRSAEPMSASRPPD
jgi:mRNA-degrading endonuclease toxin of MazEF toxin-antitoxin module